MARARRASSAAARSRASQGVPVPVRDQPSHALVVQLPKALAPYARTALRWRPNCEVAVLRDGEQTYPAMLAAMSAAKHSICLEVYILAADTTGNRFKEVLVERAKAGVAVRLIYDAVGSFGLPGGWVGELRGAGCEVIDFNPISPWRKRFRMSHRDHRKIIVVDDEIAFTGGLNIANEYASVADGGGGWHDMHCRVTGQIVLDLSRMFRRTWMRAGGKYYPPVPPTDSWKPTAGDSFVRLLDNTRRRQRAAIRRVYLHVIRNARQSVLIENAYFLPDRGVRRALARAARRGVDVRVIVPGHSDVRMVEWAGLYVLRGLARHGIKILRWRGPMLHAKTAVVDGTWSTIGSYNFDAMSRFSNLEVTVEILDHKVGDALIATFDHTVETSDRYDYADWKALPWWTKAMAWVSYRLRRFL